MFIVQLLRRNCGDCSIPTKSHKVKQWRISTITTTMAKTGQWNLCPQLMLSNQHKLDQAILNLLLIDMSNFLINFELKIMTAEKKCANEFSCALSFRHCTKCHLERGHFSLVKCTCSLTQIYAYLIVELSVSLVWRKLKFCDMHESAKMSAFGK
jgi:hypothetical protein